MEERLAERVARTKEELNNLAFEVDDVPPIPDDGVVDSHDKKIGY